MNSIIQLLRKALILTVLAGVAAGCSKNEAEQAAEGSPKTPSLSDVTDPQVTRRALEAEQSKNAAKGDPSRPFEQYESLDSGNQLMATLISMGAMPMDYEEFANRINEPYEQERDAFKKRELLNNLKPQLDALIIQARERRYVYTDHTPYLSEFDFNTMSYKLDGLPEKDSSFYFRDNSKVRLSYSNSDVFGKLKLTEEQARVVEEYRSKYRDMNLRVYMFMNVHELGSPEIKAEIMHVSLIGSKGEILASM